MGQILEWDGELLLWIQENIRREWLSPLISFITHLGDAGFIWIVITLCLLIYKGTRKEGFLCACSLLLVLLINNIILKNVIARTRPYEIVEGLQRIIEAQSDFSFPSGHTGSSFAAAVVMFMRLPKRYGIPAMVLAVCIALSRLYVGVHYPTDVMAAALIGTVTAVFVCKMAEYIEMKKKGVSYGGKWKSRGE